jgi:hypothetical protein
MHFTHARSLDEMTLDDGKKHTPHDQEGEAEADRDQDRNSATRAKRLFAVPVPLAGPTPWWKSHEIDAEVPKASRIAQGRLLVRAAQGAASTVGYPEPSRAGTEARSILGMWMIFPVAILPPHRGRTVA